MKLCLSVKVQPYIEKNKKIHGFESPSVITREERRPDIIIRDTNKLYVIAVGFETRISINAERKLKHYENLCKELRNTFQSVTYINLSMGALGLIGKNCKEFYELLKTTMQLDNEQMSYLNRKITSLLYKMYQS